MLSHETLGQDVCKGTGCKISKEESEFRTSDDKCELGERFMCSSFRVPQEG